MLISLSPRPPPAHTPAARGGGGGGAGGGTVLDSYAGTTRALSPSTTSSSFAAPHSSPPPPPPAAAVGTARPLPSLLVPQVDHLERVLEDLDSYQIPELGDCRGPRPWFDQLTTQVRHELAGVKRDLDQLRLDVDDLKRLRDRQDGQYHVDRLQTYLDQCTRSYRSAVVQAKRVIDSSQHYLNRDELLAPPPPSGDTATRNSAKPKDDDDALMSATSDVTEGLRRTLQLLQSEVDRSQVSNELLEQQTATIKSTSTEYSTLSTLLSNSKRLVTSLERADVVDRIVLFGAFSVFVAVCSYIFKKRVVDRGLQVAGAFGGLVSKAGSLAAVGDRTPIVASGGERRGPGQELEAVAAMATAAVIGAVKRAKGAVEDKWRERGGRGDADTVDRDAFSHVVPISANRTDEAIGGDERLAGDVDADRRVTYEAATTTIAPTMSEPSIAVPAPSRSSPDSTLADRLPIVEDENVAHVSGDDVAPSLRDSPPSSEHSTVADAAISSTLTTQSPTTATDSPSPSSTFISTTTAAIIEPTPLKDDNDLESLFDEVDDADLITPEPTEPASRSQVVVEEEAGERLVRDEADEDDFEVADETEAEEEDGARSRLAQPEQVAVDLARQEEALSTAPPPPPPPPPPPSASPSSSSSSSAVLAAAETTETQHATAESSVPPTKSNDVELSFESEPADVREGEGDELEQVKDVDPSSHDEESSVSPSTPRQLEEAQEEEDQAEEEEEERFDHDAELDAKLDVVNPRQLHAPIPAHSRQELEQEIFAPRDGSSEETDEREGDDDETRDVVVVDDKEGEDENDESERGGRDAVILERAPGVEEPVDDLDPTRVEEEEVVPPAPVRLEQDVIEEDVAPTLDHGTTPLDSAEVNPESIPRFDDVDELRPESTFEQQVEDDSEEQQRHLETVESVARLPIEDVDPEVVQRGEEELRSQVVAESHKADPVLQEDDDTREERLLEDMFERQQVGAAIAYVVPGVNNGTDVVLAGEESRGEQQARAAPEDVVENETINRPPVVDVVEPSPVFVEEEPPIPVPKEEEEEEEEPAAAAEVGELETEQPAVKVEEEEVPEQERSVPPPREEDEEEEEVEADEVLTTARARSPSTTLVAPEPVEPQEPTSSSSSASSEPVVTATSTTATDALDCQEGIEESGSTTAEPGHVTTTGDEREEVSLPSLEEEEEEEEGTAEVEVGADEEGEGEEEEEVVEVVRDEL
ncbi:hypothetical protein JCM3766R1_002487 [Sporobolomyces carnicolor]